MFEYLRKEIFMLREKNGDLKGELREAENDKRELLSHAESAETAASSSRLRVATLTKSNAVLMSEILEHKNDTSHLRREIRTLSSSRDEQAATLKSDYARVLKDSDSEIRNLQATIKEGRSTREFEKNQFKDQIAKMEQEHLNEVLRLKDELRRTQDSHHDYLAKLMDVLETTHAARESETARISAELNAVKEEKDSQIRNLQREVETLRHFNRIDVGALQNQISSKVTEVNVIQRELERNTAVRGQRGIKFTEVSSKLSHLVAPENLVAITSARRGRGKKLSVVEEESHRMKKMIRFLEDLYSLEETSQSKIDFEMLRMIDSYKATYEPNRVLSDLQMQIKKVESENMLLKEEVKSNGSCTRCESRDQRRAVRQRNAISPTAPTSPHEVHPKRDHESSPGNRNGF